MFAIPTATAVASVVAAVALASPAVAATEHATTLRVSPAGTAAMSRDALHLRLDRAGTGRGVKNAAADFTMRMRGAGSHTWSRWTSVPATARTKAGDYTVDLTMPSAARRHAEKYQLRFTGSTSRDLRGTDSNIVTIAKG